MENTEIQVVNQAGQSGAAMTIHGIADRVNLVHQALKTAMKLDTHYGKVPGCGDKMVLLKPGAEMLAMMFRLSPSYQITKTELPDGHREYELLCTMKATDGTTLGQGVGTASTMESKFKRPNVADIYNTVMKMAKKRAFTDCTLTCTGASDIFTQDLIENEDGDPAPTRPPVAMPAAKATPVANSAPVEGEILEGIVEDVAVKTGEKNGKPWTRYGIKIGKEFYNTFSDTIGHEAQECRGTTVKLTWKVNGNFKDAVAIEPIMDENDKAVDAAM
jgi:hypothetical protein